MQTAHSQPRKHSTASATDSRQEFSSCPVDSKKKIWICAFFFFCGFSHSRLADGHASIVELGSCKHVCGDMCVDMCMDMGTDYEAVRSQLRDVLRPMVHAASPRMRMDTCIEMCIMGMCVDTHICVRIDRCSGTCMDMCMDIYRGVHRHVCRRVRARPSRSTCFFFVFFFALHPCPSGTPAQSPMTNMPQLICHN